MKDLLNKEVLSDRFIIVVTALAVVTAVFTLVVFISSGRIENQNTELRSQLEEMKTLQQDLIFLRDIVETQEKKIGLTKVSGVVPAMEQIFKKLGFEAKVIKSLGKNKAKEFIEEDAEVQIEDIDLNKIVNLLYRIDVSATPLKVKTISVETAFENPEMFTLNMTVSFISK